MTPRGAFEGLKRDPITGAMIAAGCWNGFHDTDEECTHEENKDCECWCHTGGPDTEDSRQADAEQVESRAL